MGLLLTPGLQICQHGGPVLLHAHLFTCACTSACRDQQSSVTHVFISHQASDSASITGPRCFMRTYSHTHTHTHARTHIHINKHTQAHAHAHATRAFTNAHRNQRSYVTHMPYLDTRNSGFLLQQASVLIHAHLHTHTHTHTQAHATHQEFHALSHTHKVQGGG